MQIQLDFFSTDYREQITEQVKNKNPIMQNESKEDYNDFIVQEVDAIIRDNRDKYFKKPNYKG